MNRPKKRTCKQCGKQLEPHIKAINDLYPAGSMAGLCDRCRAEYINAKYQGKPTPNDK